MTDSTTIVSEAPPRPQGVRTAPSPTVSLIIPVGGAGDGFEDCLRSLQRLEPGPDELLIVVDGAHAGRQKMIEEARIGARVFVLEQSRGPAAARNLAANEALGDLLLFLDADVQPTDDLITQIRTLFRERPELDAVIGSYDDAPARRSFLSQYRNLLHHFVHQHSHDDASTFWSGCGVVRRSILAAAGGYDESFARPSVEDIDLGMRLRRAGCRIALVKELQVKHLKRWSVGNMLYTDLWLRAVPWTQLMLSEGHLLDDLNVRTRYRWAVVASYLLALGSLLALVAAAWAPTISVFGSALALVGLMGVLVTGADLYAFLLRRGGAWFALRSIFWHWVYHLICGLGFVIGWWRHRTAVSGRRGTS